MTDRGSAGSHPPSPTASSRWWAHRWLHVLAAALAITALVGVLLARSGGPIAADTTEHIELKGTLGPLSTDNVVHQQFVAEADELTSVQARFGTFGGVRRCAVRAELRSGDQTIASNVLPCGSLPDTVPVTVLRFAPQPASGGRVYDLQLSLAEGGGDSVTVWAGDDLSHRLPLATVGVNNLPATMEIHTSYGGDHHAWDQIGLALRRMQQYRPWFQHQAVTVAYAAIAVAALLVLVVVRGRAALVVLIVLVVAKGLLWAAIVPPLEAPDEPAHFAYAQFMAEAHRLPKRDTYQLGLPPSQSYSPQLDAAIAALHQETEPPGDRPDFAPKGTTDAVDGVELQSPAANGAGPAAGYAPVYYFPAALLYGVSSGPLVHTLELLRLWSIGLGVLAAVFVLFIGRRLFPGREAAAIALAVACAMQPELSQQTATLNNDALVIAAGAAGLLVAYDLTRRAPDRSRRLCLFGGLALGLAMFKSFGVILAPVLLVAWVIGRVRTARDERPSIWRELAQTVAGLAVTVGAWMLYAAAFGFKGASLADITPTDKPKDLATYLHILRVDWFQSIRQIWIDQLWGNFSWVDTPLPTWVQDVLLVGTLVTIALAIAWAVRITVRAIHRRGDDQFVQDAAHTGISILSIVVMFVFFVVLGYLNFHHTGVNNLIQGRYALMLVPAMLALPALTLRTVWPRLDPLVPLLLAAAAMVALDIGGIALVVERFYL